MFHVTIGPNKKANVIALWALSVAVLIAECAHAAEPQWIWGSPNAEVSAPDGLVLFKKDFDLKGQPKSANLRITCDDQYVVRVNDRLVGVNEDWHDIERFEISAVLQPGKNSIFIRSRNLAKGPAGLMFDLEITGENDDQVTIVSDDTWEASVQKSGTWNPDASKIKSWKPAAVLGSLSTAMPWKDELSESDAIRVTGRTTQPRDQFELLDGDRVLLLGNTVIEREQRYGYWEAALTTRYPDRKIIFRNLGWSGDTVLGEARARFGTQAEGFAHLEVHVHAVNPTMIVCGYGSNAAFHGPDGLDAFIANYNNLLDAIETTGAAITLMAPLRHEPHQGRYLSPGYNANRDLYAKAIKQLASERDCLFFELPQDHSKPLTDNGIHLNEKGYGLSATALEQALGLSSRAADIRIDAKDRDAEWNKTQGIDVDPRSISISANRDRVRFRMTREHLAVPYQDLGTLAVRGLMDGEYTMTVDGVQLEDTVNAETLAKGIPLPSPAKSNKLLSLIRKKNELYFHRWRPQNETYLFLFRKHEQGNNAVEIPQFDALVESIEQEIDELKRPMPIEVSVKLK